MGKINTRSLKNSRVFIFSKFHEKPCYYLLIIYKENVWTYLYLQYVKDRKAGKDRGIIILTCSQQLNCEGRRSTYTYIYIHIHTYIHGEVERHIVQAAIRQLTTDHSLGRLGVDFTKGVTHLVITLVRPGLT